MEYTVKVDQEGTIHYYKPGTDLLHREDGPAVVCNDGQKEWFIDGKWHREDGPAIIYAGGYKAWYKQGKRHREDGPAREFANGGKEWWIDGKKLKEQEFENLTKEAKVRTFTVPTGTKEIRIQFE